MSLRRVDDDDVSALSSIDAAIGALADRLPVATRLNHVLTIGAKFKLEQQQQQHLQPRKPVSTDAYRRSTSGRWGNLYENCDFRPNQLFKVALTAYKNAMIQFGMNPTDLDVQRNAVHATRDLVGRVLANNTPRLKAIDYLRQEDCYVALNYMANSNQVPMPSRQWARFMMRESLHHDKTVSPINIYYTADGQCRMSRDHLQAYGGTDFDYTEPNYPPMSDAADAQHKMLERMCAGEVERDDRDVLNEYRAQQEPGLHKVNRQLERMSNREPDGPRFLGGADEYLPNVHSRSGHRGPDRNPRFL